MHDLKELSGIIHIVPKNEALYELALTHPSNNADANTKHEDYERLEFMGDAVLDFVSAELIFRMHPEMDQGVMSKLRSYLVKSQSLAEYARRIALYDYIKVGHSLTGSQIRSSDKILEDVFEALVGAIYLDQGISVVEQYIESFLKKDIEEVDVDILTDYKTKLQEAMQAEYRSSVQYELVEAFGPAHDRTFTVRVTYNGIPLGVGTGKSKKAAEEAAAKDALSKKSV